MSESEIVLLLYFGNSETVLEIIANANFRLRYPSMERVTQIILNKENSECRKILHLISHLNIEWVVMFTIKYKSSRV